ncbi:hypothetical protein GJAV_G00258980 [Gymnothorax javanicus]|nr:hypothetical protein GJAV_G00258980 [Gymnothorax javanicus]
MSADFVDAVLNGDLEVAGKTIEEGSFPVEDVDRPLSNGGGTALIAASQRGLTRAVHFLVEKGADLTLSNYMDQTALHLSGPDLQGELLEAASRCPYPQVQLRYAAWWGDLHFLQNLLVQQEQVDVNMQNQDGLTPLMLAVRDVDLFEGLETQMTWEYRPVEVVKELLAHHAALAVYDQRGHCALYYAALLKSQLREELIQLFLESFSQPEPTGLYLHCCEAEELPTNSPDSQLTRSFVIENAANTEGYTRHTSIKTDKRISLSFHTARETLWSMRKEYQELEGKGSGGTSLPSLWDNGRQPDKPCTLDTGQGLVKTKGHPCLPSPPKAAGKKEAKPPSLTGPHAPQLTQSTPILTESLLDSGSLLRVRAHIQTRLGRSEPDIESHSRRQFLPSPLSRPLRTPKLLEPLESGQRNKALQLTCSYLLPRPQGLLPLTSSSKAKRERLTWRGSRGPHRVRGGGSEESSSSSVSSQGSLDLEEEEQEEEAAEGKEDIRESTGLSDNQPAGSKGVPPATEPCESLVLDLSPSFQPFVRTSHDAAAFCGKQGAIDNCMEDRGSIISCADKTADCEVLFGAARSELAAKEKKCNGTEVTDTKDAIVSAIGKGQAAPKDGVFAVELAELELSARPMHTGSLFPQRNISTVTETSGAYNLKSHSNADKNHLGLLHVVNITVSESNAPSENNPISQKTNLTKERGNPACFRTNQSFNILAYKDHSRFTKKSKNVQRSSSRGTHLKSNIRNPSDLTVSGEATAKQCVSRTSGSKANRKITTALQQNKSTEHLRPVTKGPVQTEGSPINWSLWPGSRPFNETLSAPDSQRRLGCK